MMERNRISWSVGASINIRKEGRCQSHLPRMGTLTEDSGQDAGSGPAAWVSNFEIRDKKLTLGLPLVFRTPRFERRILQDEERNEGEPMARVRPHG